MKYIRIIYIVEKMKLPHKKSATFWYLLSLDLIRVINNYDLV